MDKKFFWDGLVKDGPDGAVMTGQRCPKCGETMFPTVLFCPKCLSEELEEFEIGSVGELFCFTTTRVPTEHFDPPYTHGMIKFPETKMRIVAPIETDDPSELQIGDKLKCFIDVVWKDEKTGEDLYGYKFRKVEG